MNNMLFSSLSFPLISLIFIFLTIFLLLYRMNNKDNTKSIIYYYVIFTTLIVILFEILSAFTIKNRDAFPLLNQIICRSYIFFSIAWTDVLLYYLYLYKKDFNRKKLSIFIIINLILSVVLCILVAPEFNSENFYTITGPLITILHIWCSIVCLFEGIILFSKKIIVKNLEVLPLYVGAITYVIIILYQIITGRFYSILSFMYTLIVISLFYSAESQDNKLIDEYENQKIESEKVNEEKEKFLFNMSKEIRTPMSNIIGLCNIISLNKNELEAKDINDEGRKIYSESKKLLSSVNNILDLARFEAKKEELNEKNYSFEEMIFEINYDIVNKYNLFPEYKFKNNLPTTLYGDSNKIKKIIDLVIEKEIKEVLIGKIIIEYSYEYIDSDIYKGIIQLSMIYDGIIDKEIENGLDLEESIIDKCRELLNCEIEEIQVSEVKKEYTIKYTQKIIDAREIPDIDNKVTIRNNRIKEIGTKEKNVNFSNKKILIVDDSQININILKRLIKYNVRIESALSGEKCIEKCKENKFDLILLDDMMPGLSGVDTLNELKKIHKKLPPIIVVTANSRDGLKEKYINLGFDNYISKPIDAKIINNMIGDYLSKGGDNNAL